VLHVAWLRADLGPLQVFKWAQYASGVIGLAVVLGALIAELRSRPATRAMTRRVLPSPLLPLVVLAAAGYGIVAGLDRWGGGFHAVAFHGVARGIVALAAGTSITCCAWLLVARSRPA
jgi:hypothetical protein